MTDIEVPNSEQLFSKDCSIYRTCPEGSLEVQHAPFYSFVEEFEMLCGQEAYFATIISTVQFVGLLIGTVISGQLGDSFGRKKVSLVGIAILIASGSISGGFYVTCQRRKQEFSHGTPSNPAETTKARAEMLTL